MNPEELSCIEKLKDSRNFPIWKFQVTIFLKAKDIYEVTTGGEPQPQPTTSKGNSNSAEIQKWKKNDALAQKIIITTIEKQPMTHLLTCKTAKEMFEKLTKVFERNIEQQKYQLLQQFYNFQFTKGMDVSTYISDLENIVYKLKSLNQDISDTMLLTKILSGLPENFRHFLSAWESTQESEKTLENLSSRLSAEEARLKTEVSESDQIAFATGSGNYGKKKPTNESKMNPKMKEQSKNCFRCGRTGHFARFCPEKNQKHCNICKKNNHNESDCYFKKSNNNQKENKSKVAFMSTEEPKLTEEIENTWIIDSGASTHMVNDQKLLTNLKEDTSDISTSKKNQKMKALGVGNVEAESCTLNNVIYIPDLSKNLLSVSKITSSGGEVIFKQDKVEVFVEKRKILAGQKNGNGMYEINLNKRTEESLHTEEDDIKIWHKKIGHVSNQNLRKLKELSVGFKPTEKQIKILEDMICESCVEAKQTRKPFDQIRQRATRPLELLHTDLCGPIDPISWDGMKYFITVLDDYTHFATVHLLKGKYEASSTIKDVINEYEAKWNLKVAKIRSDNGKEYINNDLKKWCKEKGINLDYTVKYSPQQNGKAERLNRTLLDKTRSMLFDSKLDKEMWGESLRVAAYLTNRMPTKSLEVEKTPYEMWFHRKPNLKNLQVFGATAFAKNLGHLKKLDKRTENSIL